jgi:thiamine-phosphate diphosphorylase
MNDKRTAGPTLMLLTDRRRSGGLLLATIDRVVDAGVDVVQIREKDLEHRALLSLAREIVAVVGNRARVIVNSDVEVARVLGIGVHLPEAAPPLSGRPDTRMAAGVLVGRSIHAVGMAVEERVDYLLFGHVFATNSKPGLQPRGLDGLAEIVDGRSKPVWAIGGITAANAGDVIERGAQGIAVIGAILDAPDPREATLALRSAIDQAATARTAIR